MNRFIIDYILPQFNLIYNFFPYFYLHLYSFYKQISEMKKVNFLKSFLKEGDIVLDIGANVGFYTNIFADLVGKSGKVYAFEPDKKNYNLLLHNSRYFNNIKFFNKAVGVKNETIKLYESSTRNTDHQTYNIGDSRKYTQIKCIKIDDLKLNLKNLRLIKIDVQGYDYFALKGMSRTLRKSKNTIIFGEIWPYGLKKSGSSTRNYMKLIKNLGFKLFESELNYSDIDKYESDKYYYTDFLAKKI